MPLCRLRSPPPRWGLLLVLLPLAAAYPQAPKTPSKLQWSTPPPGDIEVFYSYLLRAHGEISAVGRAKSTTEKAAVTLHSQVADLAPLENAYQTTTAGIAAVRSETRAYHESVVNAGQKPDRDKLKAYYARRVQLLRAASEQLRTTLGNERWAKLQGYIDGEFRSHLKVAEIPHGQNNKDIR